MIGVELKGSVDLLLGKHFVVDLVGCLHPLIVSDGVGDGWEDLGHLDAMLELSLVHILQP